MKTTEEYARAILSATNKSEEEEARVINDFWKDTVTEIARLAKEADQKGLVGIATVFAICEAMHKKWQKVALITKRFHPSSFAFLAKERMPEIYPEWAIYRARIGKPIDLSYFEEKRKIVKSPSN